MDTQIESFMEDKLSNLLTGFRKNQRTQHCLINMLGKWKNTLDKSGFVCAMFMQLSKAFDTINHDCQVRSIWFSKRCTFFLKSNLAKRRQRVRVNSNFSVWKRTIPGVPQSSILSSLLFSIFSNDLFLFVENSNLSNYTDDSTLYSCGNNLEEVKQNLSGDFQIVTKWFYENNMVLNSGKCHSMCLGKNTENKIYFFNNTEMKNSQVKSNQNFRDNY